MVQASEGKQGNREGKRGDGDTSEFGTAMGKQGNKEGKRGDGDTSEFGTAMGASESGKARQ
jgi:hypothetical protein